MGKENMEEKSAMERLDYYCDNTEVALGDLYLFEFTDKRKITFYYPSSDVIEAHPNFLFDDNKNKGNVHIFPADIKLAELCSKVNNEKMKEIFKCIKEKVPMNNEENKDKYKYNGIISYSRKESGWEKIVNSTSYKNAGHLFAYLQVIGDLSGTRYDLVFDRFFFDHDRVSCILLCFQIKMYPKGDEPKSIECYPHTPYDSEGNKHYYNLDVDIHSDAETIAEKFLEFVKEKEEEKAQKKEEH